MRKLAIALLASVPLFFASQASLALEPWHDYYTAKAMKDKAAKKRMAQTNAPKETAPKAPPKPSTTETK